MLELRHVDAGTGIFLAVLGSLLLLFASSYTLEVWRDRRNPLPAYRTQHGQAVSPATKLRELACVIAAALVMLVGGILIAVTSHR